MKNKTTLIFAINDFLIGGAQKLIVDLCKEFPKEKYDIHIITLLTFSGKNTFYEQVPASVRVHVFSFKSFFDFVNWKNLYLLVKEIRPNIVISNLFFANTVFRVLKILIGYKVIVVEHNTYTNKKIVHVCIDSLLSFVTSKIIAVSKTVAEFTSKQEKISKYKFEIIYNGCNILEMQQSVMNIDKDAIKSSLGFLLNEKIIINVARLTAQKNHDLLIDSFAAFIRDKKELYTLVILGEGSLYEELLHKVQSLGLNDRVKLLGFKKDVSKYYAISEFFLSTSYIEGLSVAYIEALAHGLPIVATNTAGTDELVQNGVNGFIIDSYNIENVVTVMNKVILSNMSSMRDNALQSVKKFSIQETSKKYLSLIEKTLN